MGEFELIKKYFAKRAKKRSDVIVGIGDDAAVVRVPSDCELVITTDTLVENIHFLASTDAQAIGHKSLAVNLSDLAAMGATPAWVTLALTMPSVNESWLDQFCQGFFTLAHHHAIELIGGDLTKGPLSITIQALGLIPKGQALLRSGAKPEDLIYVTGTLGDAGYALNALQKHQKVDPFLFTRLHRPEPRIAIGEALRQHAHAAIDLSDGFAADLSHILEESRVGASIHVALLPLSDALKKAISIENAIQFALTSGDDYELCFTIPPDAKNALEKHLSQFNCPVSYVGKITKEPGLHLHNQNGKPYHGAIQGYEHF